MTDHDLRLTNFSQYLQAMPIDIENLPECSRDLNCNSKLLPTSPR